MTPFSVTLKRSYLFWIMNGFLACAAFACIFLLSMNFFIKLILAGVVIFLVWRARPKLLAIEWTQKHGWIFCYSAQKIPIKIKPIILNRFLLLINGEIIFRDALESESLRQLIKKILADD